jgi:O-antigen/teichoic acid export membrane protein
MVAQAIAVITGLGNSLVLSRYLGVEGFGQFSYVFAFYFFFLTLNDFGLNSIVLREVSQRRDKADEIIGAMRTFKVGLSLLLLVIAWTTIWLMQLSADLRNALMLFGFMLPLLALQLPIVIFQVNLQAAGPAIIGTVNRCLGFVLILVAVALGRSLLAVVAALLVSETISLGLLLIMTRRLVRPVWQIARHVWSGILRSSVPLGLAGLCSAVINRVDFVMLERMTDLHQLGLYSAAYKVTNLLETFPLILMATIYPLMTRWVKEDSNRLKRLYKHSMLLLAVVGLPVGAVVTIGAPWIVQLVFGSDFAGTVPALRVLVWATVAMYLAITSGNLLISMGRERINLLLNFCGAVLNVALNFWFIPAWGFIGAAWATTITFVFVLVGVTFASIVALSSATPRHMLGEFKSGHASV